MDYYTPGGSEGIFTTPTPHAYRYYNGNYLSGTNMEYGKRYYLWFKRTSPNTWQKSQFYIDFQEWSYESGTTLTFIINTSANVEPSTSLP